MNRARFLGRQVPKVGVLERYYSMDFIKAFHIVYLEHVTNARIIMSVPETMSNPQDKGS